MRRTRARLLAAAAVIATAGAASASIVLGVKNLTARNGYYALANDVGMMFPDAPVDTLIDFPMEGGSPDVPFTPPDAKFFFDAPDSSIVIPDGSFTPPDSDITIDDAPIMPDAGVKLDGGMPDSGMMMPDGSIGAALRVEPGALAFGQVAVTATANPTTSITIYNDGGAQLDNIVIDFGTSVNASQWRASACESSACTLAPFGNMQVDITFDPTSHGVKDLTLTATSSNGGSDTVLLTGTGMGGLVSVKTPAAPSYTLNFGRIPRGQAFPLDIELQNPGNAPYSAATTAPNAPYMIANGPFSVASGATVPITVTCESAMPSTNNNPQPVTIISTDAYNGPPENPIDVHLECEIANTLLQIMPTMFDFGEVRIGTSVAPIGITLTNPSSSASATTITAFDLQAHKPGLHLSTPALPFSLSPGMMENASLALDTANETDLTGEFLDITVDGEQLMFPVKGKVVTPHSHVSPPNRLDLGSACTGTSVTGHVTWTNDGTASLMLDPPQMSQSFLASAMGTPNTFAAGTSIVADVSPVSSAMGQVEGLLTWHDDVPNNYEITVVLDYVVTGTALSPRGLDFGSVEVGQPQAPQQIRLQNCDMTSSNVKVESLKTKQGTLGAWHIDPRVGYAKDLGGREQLAITVSFEPPARGRYEADLTMQTASGKQIVHLVGDATGRDWDNTSFYACACNGPGAPQRGWPVLVAIAIVIFRRRRGSSSAR